jgi:MFS superfamily sulfate permease-like transporter
MAERTDTDAAAPRAGLAETLPRDLTASVVVFLVALPLCLGVAQASGMPPAAGIVTGIIGGLIVGLIAGCPLQVSGPAAGLIVIIMEMEPAKHPGLLGAVVLLAGLIQLAMGLSGLGQWFRAVSPAVIQGMLAGIGVIILASQLHSMAGIDFRGEYLGGAAEEATAEHGSAAKAEVTGLDYFHHLPETFGAVIAGAGKHRSAFLLGVATIAIIVGWKWLTPKKWQLLPGTLLAVVVATVTAQFLALDVQRVELPASLFSAVQYPTDASMFLRGEVWMLAVTVALIASAETLLCAAAVDTMQTGQRTDYNRELSAQGVGNALCGLLGALPMTGVIVRSSANIEAGARTRLSAILHGLWLVLFVVALPWVLTMIPTAALAAILVYTGFKLVDFKAMKGLAKVSRSELLIFLATLAGVLAMDLLKGVLLGVALAAVKLLYTFSHLSIRVDDRPDGNRTVLHLEGAATFIRLPQLAATLESVRPETELHVHLEELSYIDHACLELFVNWEKRHEANGGSLVIEWDSLWAKFRGGPNGNGNGRPGANGNGKAAASVVTNT